MRNAFADEIGRLATDDTDIVLLSGDIGNRLFDKFQKKFSQRFVNCGVAEANMTGVAAGLAMTGLKPVTYSIAAFNTYRCLEQIRVDLCYHNLPVTIIGVGGGLSYAGLGYTHHASEDLGVLRLFPNMTVLCPCDANELRGALRAAVTHHGPVYIRMGKKGEPDIHHGVPDFAIGKGLKVKEGNDICILGVGSILSEVLKADTLLTEQGISSSIYSFPSVKPLDEGLLQKVFNGFPLVVSVEEHTRLGGTGAAIAEWLVDTYLSNAGAFLRLALPDKVFNEGGDQYYARESLGLTGGQIFDKILTKIKIISK